MSAKAACACWLLAQRLWIQAHVVLARVATLRTLGKAAAAARACCWPAVSWRGRLSPVSTATVTCTPNGRFDQISREHLLAGRQLLWIVAGKNRSAEITNHLYFGDVHRAVFAHVVSSTAARVSVRVAVALPKLKSTSTSTRALHRSHLRRSSPRPSLVRTRRR